jgi:hypothetical protein
LLWRITVTSTHARFSYLRACLGDLLIVNEEHHPRSLSFEEVGADRKWQIPSELTTSEFGARKVMEPSSSFKSSELSTFTLRTVIY